MSDYSDILRLPRFEPQHHRRMSVRARAAQFAPFAALTGFDDEIEETARLTDQKHSLTEEELDALNHALVYLLGHEAERPEVTVTYFQPDALKSGGAYVTYTGNLRFLEEAAGVLHFTDGSAIAIREVQHLDLRGSSA